MVSFDVKSFLFTSIPVDLALTITNQRLQQDQDLAERTNMSISNIMRLLEFVLNRLLQTRQHPLQTNLWMCDGFSNQSCYS